MSLRLTPTKLGVGAEEIPIAADGGAYGPSGFRTLKAAFPNDKVGTPLIQVEADSSYRTFLRLLADLARTGRQRVRVICSGDGREIEILTPQAGKGPSTTCPEGECPQFALALLAVARSGYLLGAATALVPSESSSETAVIPRLGEDLDLGALRALIAKIKAAHPNERNIIVGSHDLPDQFSQVCASLEVVAKEFQNIAPTEL